MANYLINIHSDTCDNSSPFITSATNSNSVYLSLTFVSAFVQIRLFPLDGPFFRLSNFLVFSYIYVFPANLYSYIYTYNRKDNSAPPNWSSVPTGLFCDLFLGQIYFLRSFHRATYNYL